MTKQTADQLKKLRELKEFRTYKNPHIVEKLINDKYQREVKKGNINE
jgi:hypothetical protein